MTVRTNDSLETQVLNKRYGVLVELKGSLCASTYNVFQELVPDLIQKETLHLALDLSELIKIDAKGVYALTELLTLLDQKGVELYAFGMNEDVYDILSFVDMEGEIHLLHDKMAFLNFMNTSHS
jgi:anti-anti-sigma factor